MSDDADPPVGLARLCEICESGRVADFSGLSAAVGPGVLAGLMQMRFDRKNRVTPLILCVKNGHHELARKMLSSGGARTINFAERHGATALVTAAGYGHTRCVVELLACGQVDVCKQDVRGLTPLDWAAYNGHVASVILLLRHDLSIPFHAFLCAFRKGRILALAILSVVTYFRCWQLAVLWSASQIESLFMFLVLSPCRMMVSCLGVLCRHSTLYVTQRRASMHIHVGCPAQGQSVAAKSE